MAMSSRIREACILGVTTLASCVGSVGLTMLLTSLPTIQSTSISNAGQAYGAAAAATSVVVLIYIARTFRHQNDESRMHREVLEAQTAELCLQRESTQGQHKTVQRSAEAAVRARHIKLLEMAINDPVLMQCWPVYGIADSDELRKQYIYCNLIISHHCMCYELGYFTDEEVEQTLYHTFSNDVVRNFWEATRPARTRTAPHGGQLRKFYDMAELAYLRQVDDHGVA
jgi:cell division protein FtsL